MGDISDHPVKVRSQDYINDYVLDATVSFIDTQSYLFGALADSDATNKAKKFIINDIQIRYPNSFNVDTQVFVAYFTMKISPIILAESFTTAAAKAASGNIDSPFGYYFAVNNGDPDLSFIGSFDDTFLKTQNSFQSLGVKPFVYEAANKDSDPDKRVMLGIYPAATAPSGGAEIKIHFTEFDD